MTTKGRYALRAAIALARMSVGMTPVSIKTISDAESISPEFLEQIFFRLRKSGLISSVRGPGGGFFFAKPLSDILLKDIVEASGEGMELAACACGLSDSCIRATDCVAGTVWREFSAHIDQFLTGMTLADIVARSLNEAKEQLPEPVHA
jgi:Rrf2 family iron-sulfur cluster assembly transcriptional regulator